MSVLIILLLATANA
jgi:hypothetical protein